MFEKRREKRERKRRSSDDDLFWTQKIAQFLLGGMIGCVAGFLVYLRGGFHAVAPFWIWFPAWFVVVGLAAAIVGDRFFDRIDEDLTGRTR